MPAPRTPGVAGGDAPSLVIATKLDGVSRDPIRAAGKVARGRMAVQTPEGWVLTVYPDAGHDSWTETYNNPEFYDWLLAQKRARKE